jgi:hypothetical protein
MIRAAAVLCAMAAAPALGQELLPSPPLQPDIMALPRLAGNSPAIQQINTELQRLDDVDLKVLNCYYGSRSDDPLRSVEVLSDGPEFLSLLIATSTFCEGAAHPWSEQKIVTFDLETGKTTELHEYFPPAWGTVEHPEDLLSIYFLNLLDDLPMDCVPAYARAVRNAWLYFDLGVSKADRALILWPSGVAPVESHCLQAIHVPVEQLLDAGFHGKLIDALSPKP